MRNTAKPFTIQRLSNPMKTSSLRSLATFAALRFKFFSSASRAVGDKWAGHGGPALPILGALGVLAVHSSSFAATTWSQTWNVSTAIPDNDDVGFADTRTINVPDITEIENVTVTINLSGGWNGDLYAYLVHDSGFSVLLNRPGRSESNPDGSATVGMQITFDDSAASDVHTAIPMSGGGVIGTYQPDGRITDPLVVLDTDPRPAMLSSFIGLDASGTWTLFVADQNPGDESTLQSWSLTIVGVPEPGAALLAIFGALSLLRRKR